MNLQVSSDSSINRHFSEWLSLYARPEEHEEIANSVRAWLEEYPEDIDRLSWSEIVERAHKFS